MDFSQYYVVPVAHLAAVTKLFEPHRIIEEEKFVVVISDDEKRMAKLDVALAFNNDEWAAWGFTLFVKGKPVANGLFGENDETGVSAEDNCLEGDLDKAAKLLGVDPTKLRKVVEAEEPDVEEFMKVVGFERYSITPFELDSAVPKEKKALFDPEHFVIEDGVAKRRRPRSSRGFGGEAPIVMDGVAKKREPKSKTKPKKTAKKKPKAKPKKTAKKKPKAKKRKR